jgi:hypothetical protein
VCLFSGANDSPTLALDSGAIDGLSHWEARCIFYQRWFPDDEWLSHKHKIVDCIYKQFIFHILLILSPCLGDTSTDDAWATITTID